MTKQRLDLLVAAKGLVESREQARRLIMAGQVRVNGQLATKPGHTFPETALIEVSALPRFVGRGGEKLEAAMTAFKLDVAGLVCVDVGAATGGFTDCMLQRGASKVYAVDVGAGLLHWKLRNDPRVVAMEKVNARYLDAKAFPEPVRFATLDVSFISLTKVLGAVTDVIRPDSMIVSLVKPQFEAGRKDVGKGGVVRDPGVRAGTVEKIRVFGTETLGLEWIGVCESPLKGPAGNVEFLACWRKSGDQL